MQEFTTLRARRFQQAENAAGRRLAVGGGGTSMGGMTAALHPGIMTRHRGKMRGQFNGVGLFYRACPDAFPAVIPAEPSPAQQAGIRQYHCAATT